MRCDDHMTTSLYNKRKAPCLTSGSGTGSGSITGSGSGTGSGSSSSSELDEET